MSDQDKEPGTRLRLLADASADFKVDSNIPIRRYFRSGQEMIKMAEVYLQEASLEAAYVLYMKYMTLFVEKLKHHKDYSQVLPAEKKKVMSVVKDAMNKTEELKLVLKLKYEDEYKTWKKEEEIRLKREKEQQIQRDKELREAEQKKLDELASIERDRQVALWHQAQLDKEARGETINDAAFTEFSINDPSNKPYDPSKYSETPSAPTLSTNLSEEAASSNFSTLPSLPSVDRSSKPAATASASSSILLPSETPSVNSPVSLPSFDRSVKPVIKEAGVRTVVIPGNLIEVFLDIAKRNSDCGIETLGTLGGSLSKNRFVISHLLIPRQTGKSDSCTMEGLEDVWEIHDTENIIFLGWIHTHPAYSVFLSSVDMHNQYEWQHMLPEALAIVCSIKDNVVGNLRLTQAGMVEIGGCSLTNFHPHSKDLWEEASHVEVDHSKKVILKDLR